MYAAEGGVVMSRTPRTHHRPKVYKGRFFWWSACACGHTKHYQSWWRAYIDALAHGEELK